MYCNTVLTEVNMRGSRNRKIRERKTAFVWFFRVGMGGGLGFFDKKDRQIIMSKPNDMKSVAFDFVGDSEVRIGF